MEADETTEIMRAPRLHVEDLDPGRGRVVLSRPRAHYLGTVLRLGVGDPVRVFSAATGEFAARIDALDRRQAVLELGERLRAPAPVRGPELWFAPIRRTRLEWLVEKATELGAVRLVPVLTRRTVVTLRRPERLAAIAEEAAEQCERLDVPEVAAPRPLFAALAERPPGRPLLFAEERSAAPPLARVLADLATDEVTVLVGPEGGFAPEEREVLGARADVRPVSLGPAILRSETAAICALAGIRLLTEGEVLP